MGYSFTAGSFVTILFCPCPYHKKVKPNEFPNY